MNCDVRSEQTEQRCSDNAVGELIDGDSSEEADSASEHCCSNDSSSDATPKCHHRRNRTGTAAFIPHDIIQRPKLVTIATRLKVTPIKQTAYIETLIFEAGGDVSKVSTSYATTDKSRRQVGRKIASACREQWVASKLATLYWDSKQMPSLSIVK